MFKKRWMKIQSVNVHGSINLYCIKNFVCFRKISKQVGSFEGKKMCTNTKVSLSRKGQANFTFVMHYCNNMFRK